MRLRASLQDSIMPIWGYPPWIGEAGSPVAQEDACHQRVEHTCLSRGQWSWFDAVEEPLRAIGQDCHEIQDAWYGESL